jgi:hypothetical protein
MPEKRYTRVEEEILQILDKMEVVDERPAKPPLRLVRSQKRGARFTRLRRFLHAGWISLALTALFAFLAVVFQESHLLATSLAVCSILAFLSPIVLRRPGNKNTMPPQYGTKLWRGRDISLDPPRQDSAVDRARGWFDRRKGGPH